MTSVDKAICNFAQLILWLAMKLKFDRNAKIKIILVIAVITSAPYFAPFAIDFIIFADFLGFEALLVFLFAYFKPASVAIRHALNELRRSFGATALIEVE